MKITWEVEDGYCGKSRPQFTNVEDADLENCETEEEKERFIEDCIEQDYINNISWVEIRRD